MQPNTLTNHEAPLNGALPQEKLTLLHPAPTPIGALLSDPVVVAAISQALNKVPPWLKLLLAVLGIVGVPSLFAALLNVQTLWGVPDRVATIETTLVTQGKQLDRIEKALTGKIATTP